MATERALSDPPGRGGPVAGLRSGWPSGVAIVTLVAVGGWLAFEHGGYFARAFLVGGAVAFVAAAAIVVIRPSLLRVPTAALVALAALIGLAAWMGISAAWSPVPATAIEDAQRALAYVAVFGLALLAAGSPGWRRWIPWLVLATIVVILGAALGTRLLPDLLPTAASRPEAGFRLDYPLGYSNALGALAAIGATLAVGLSEDRSARLVPRALAAAAAVPLVVAMYLSLSRGAWLALAVGVVVLVVLADRRWALLATVILVGAAGAVGVLVLQDHSVLVDGPQAGQQLGEGGGGFLALLVGLTLAVGAVKLAAVALTSSRTRRPPPRRLSRRAVAAAAAIVIVVVAAALVVERERVDRASGDVQDFVERQWHDFLRPAGQDPRSARLGSTKGPRSDFYRVALDAFEAQPLRGIGSGGFGPRYVQERHTNETARDAHSLYLEVLSELGIVGGLLLLAFVVATLIGLVVTRRRPGVLGAGAVAAVGAAWVTWLVHAGIDWDWQVPALTLPALMLLAALLVRGQDDDNKATGTREER